MFRGFYTVASGMLTQQRRTEMLTNNMANANTPGFKADQSSLRAFPEMLLQRIRDPEGQGPEFAGIPRMPGQPTFIGTLPNGVYTQEYIPNFQQGQLIQTDNPYDVAIQDETLPAAEVDGRLLKPAAFFTVQTGEGEIRYTRNGKFSVDLE